MGKNRNNASATVVVVVLMFVVGLLMFALWSGAFRTRIPAQPVAGYTGDWKMHGTSGEEERPLPPAVEIWRDYNAWKPTKDFTSKFYLARLGHAERQAGFRAVTNHPASLDDQINTCVQFLYHDPTNGDYALVWQLNGEHDVNFLKFDKNERWFELQLLGSEGENPPQLKILGLEGFAPFYN
jgi:hypothetical protein